MVTNKIYYSTVSLTMKMTRDPSKQLLFNIRTFEPVMVKFSEIRVQPIPKRRLELLLQAQNAYKYISIVYRRCDYRCVVYGESLYNRKLVNLHHIKPRMKGCSWNPSNN